MAFQKTCNNILVIILFVKTMSCFDLNDYCKDRCMRGSGGILCKCSAFHFSGKRSSGDSGKSMMAASRSKTGAMALSQSQQQPWHFGTGARQQHSRQTQRNHGFLPDDIMSAGGEGFAERVRANRDDLPNPRLMEEFKENNGQDLERRDPARYVEEPPSPTGPAFWKANSESLSKGTSSLLPDSVRTPDFRRLYLYRKEAMEEEGLGRGGEEGGDDVSDNKRGGFRDNVPSASSSSSNSFKSSHKQRDNSGQSEAERWRDILTLIRKVRTRLEERNVQQKQAKRSESASSSTYGYKGESRNDVGYQLPFLFVDGWNENMMSPRQSRSRTDDDLEELSAPGTFPSTMFTTPIPTTGDMMVVTPPADRHHLSALRRVLSTVLNRGLAAHKRSVRSAPSKVKVIT